MIRKILLTSAIGIGALATSVSAGTLKIEWHGGDQVLNERSEVCGLDEPGWCRSNPDVLSPITASFVFDVDLSNGPDFSYSATMDLDRDEEEGYEYDISNPFGATLSSASLFAAQYMYGIYNMTVSASGVTFDGSFTDGNSNLTMSSHAAEDEQNMYLHIFDSIGWWTAVYQPTGTDDGAAFAIDGPRLVLPEQPSPVPLPASLPILGGALMMIGAAGARRRRNKG